MSFAFFTRQKSVWSILFFNDFVERHDLLLSKLMSGEIRVEEVEALV